MWDVDKQYSSTEIEITLIMITSVTSTAAKQPHQEEHNGHHQHLLPNALSRNRNCTCSHSTPRWSLVIKHVNEGH